MDPNTEIRKLRPAELYTLARILTASDSWKTLMAVVPKEGTEDVPKFTTEHFTLIEQASCQQRKSAAEIFLEEWSTMGKRRPTLQSMLDLLVKGDLFRAADYVAVDLLRKQPPARPTCGPAAPVDISDEEIAKLLKETCFEIESPDSENTLSSVLDGIEYPSQLSLRDSAEDRRQAERNFQPETRLVGMEFVDEMSMVRINPEEINEINSNLMQFSKSDTESRRNNNSNLIQFSTSSIQSTRSVDLERNFTADSSVALRQNTSSSNNENASDTSKLTDSRFNVQTVSNSNNCTEFELQSSELPAFVANLGRGVTLTNDELKSSELPQFVCEIAQQRLSQSGMQSNNESISEPTTMSTNSTSSNDSSNFTADATSSSNNNTESIIPICVNYASRNLIADELVSAELPQFVADLGHRQDAVDTEQFDIGNVSSDRYVQLVSQELPLVVSECNRTRSQGKGNQGELKCTELPQFVVEL